jgi:hypothetical protein
MDGRGREMYRKFDGASGDAYVTVLSHDRVQPALVDQRTPHICMYYYNGRGTARRLGRCRVVSLSDTIPYTETYD